MRVYLAASFKRKSEMRKCRDDLRKLGITVTSTWLREHNACDKTMSPAQAELRAIIDKEDIGRADLLIEFTEKRARGGHIYETGYADALGLDMLFVGPRVHVFHYQSQFSQVNTWKEALAWVRSRIKS